MSFKTLRCEREDAIATVTLDRPEVLHALDAAMFDELERAFRQLAADDSLRAILVAVDERVRLIGNPSSSNRSWRLSANSGGPA